MTPETIRYLRSIKGLSQEKVADMIGVSQPTFSLIEGGKRKADESEELRLENALAFGVPHDFEEDPVYALARLAGYGEVELLRDADGRLGVYRSSANAKLAESLLPKGGRFASIMVVPVWLSHVALEIVRHRGASATKNDMYFVDATEDAAIDVARHTVGVVASMTDGETYEEIAEQLARDLAVRSRAT